MSDIVLIGEGLDAILLPWRHPPTDQERIDRYELALATLEARGEVMPRKYMRHRFGSQFREAWREGLRPSLRFPNMPRAPLQPAPDPARAPRARRFRWLP